MQMLWASYYEVYFFGMIENIDTFGYAGYVYIK